MIMLVFANLNSLTMIREILAMLFPWTTNTTSRDNAKRRLKLIIAHDRAMINPELLKSMREEILEVVARYVEIDKDEMEFSLSNDNRTTSLTANLPIRQIKRLADLKEEIKSDDGSIKLEEIIDTELDPVDDSDQPSEQAPSV